MSLGQPWGLALLAVMAPIVVIYLLRGSPRRLPTGAAFLWRGLAEQTTARRKWRRPPRSLALLLQLLAVAVAALALAQPALGQQSSRQFVFVLDASASMQATDVSPSRFEAARAALRAELERLAPGDRATLVRLGSSAEVLASGSDRAQLLRALEAARPGVAPVRFRDALGLAAQRLEPPLAAGSEVVVFSDGSLPDVPGLGPLPAPVRFVKIGERAENQGVSELEVVPTPNGNGFGAFVRLTNYADHPAEVPARLAADGLPLETRLVSLPPRGRVELAFDVPGGARSVSVQLGGRDILPLDDRAAVSVPESQQRRALVVSRTPEPWEQALGALPGLVVETQLPEAYRDSGAELVLFDGFLPPSLPGGQLIVVNPPPGNHLVEVRGEHRDVRINAAEANSPLLRSIDLSAIRLVKAARLGVPPWASVAAESSAGPLMLQGQLDGRRVVVIGFDPFLSGLEKLVAFPLLVSNAVELLADSGVDPWVVPGQSVSLPVSAEALEVTLARPDGSLSTLDPRAGAARIETTDQIGPYLLRQRLPDGQVLARTFNVALFGETEADVAPRDLPSWPAAAPLEGAAPRPGPPIWLPFAALALALLGLEWLHYARRG